VAHRNVRRRSDVVGLILARTMMSVAALLTAIPATRLPLLATIATGVLAVGASRPRPKPTLQSSTR
jgi:hypothetical protein